MNIFGSQWMYRFQCLCPDSDWGNRARAERIRFRVSTSVRWLRLRTCALSGSVISALLVVGVAAGPPAAMGQARRAIVSRGRAFPEIGSGVTALKRDAAGRYYVLAKPANVIGVYNSDGVRVGQIPAADAPGGKIGYAVDFDLDPTGNVVVADRASNAVEIFSPQGVQVARVKVFAPTSVVALKGGQFAVTTLKSASLVVEMGSDGEIIRTFGDIPDAAPGAPPALADLGRVTGDPDGNIYFAFASDDPFIRKYDRFGYIACQAIVPHKMDSQDDTPEDRVTFAFNFSQFNLSDQFSGWTTLGLNHGDVNFGASTGMGLERAGFGRGPGGGGGAGFSGGGMGSGGYFGDGMGSGTGPSGAGGGRGNAGVVGSYQNGRFRLAPRVGVGGRGGRRGTGPTGAGAPGAAGSAGAGSGGSGQAGSDGYEYSPSDSDVDSGATTGSLQFNSGNDSVGADLTASDMVILQNPSPGTYGMGGSQFAGLGGGLPFGGQGFAELGNYLGPPPGGGGRGIGPSGLSAIDPSGIPTNANGNTVGVDSGRRNFGGAGEGGGMGGFGDHGRYGHFGGMNAYSAVASVKVNLDKPEASKDIGKSKITAIGIDRATQEIWVAMGPTLVHFDKDGNQLDSYPLTTPQGQAISASAIEVEPDRLLVASDAHGIYEFARPAPAAAVAPASAH